MSFALLFPLGLAALAAWALPLLLHLARREQQQPTDFAALRWLAAKLKPRQRLRLEEWPLLVARLALLAGLALLLAQPVWTGGGDGSDVVVVHPALARDARGEERVGRNEERVAGGNGVRRVWLAPGFPPVDADAPAPATPVDTASLLRELDATLPAASTLHVIVPGWFDGADGARIVLSRPVRWQPSSGPEPGPLPAAAAPSAALAIRHDEEHAGQLRWVRAVAVAWAVADATAALVPRSSPLVPEEIDIADVSAPLPAPTTTLAWLAAGDLPKDLHAWIDAGGTILLAAESTWPLAQPGAPLWRDGDGSVIASAAPLGRGRIVQLWQPLQPASLPALLEADFPARLRTLVLPPPPAPTRSDAATLAPRAGGSTFPAIPQPAEPLLIAIVLVLFALERWLASGRRPDPRA